MEIRYAFALIIAVVAVIVASLLLGTFDLGGGNGNDKPPFSLDAVARAYPDVVYIEHGSSALVTFDASGSNGTIVSYSWDFDDNDIADGEKVEHEYSNVGRYRATLTIRDKYGRTDNDTLMVVVNSRSKTESTVRLSRGVEHEIPVQVYARRITVKLEFPTGQIVGGIPANALLLTVRDDSGTVSRDSGDENPDSGDNQTREVIIPMQEIASVSYNDFVAEVTHIRGSIQIDYRLEILVSY